MTKTGAKLDHLVEGKKDMDSLMNHVTMVLLLIATITFTLLIITIRSFQKFTSDGVFIASVGSYGEDKL